MYGGMDVHTVAANSASICFPANLLIFSWPKGEVSTCVGLQWTLQAGLVIRLPTSEQILPTLQLQQNKNTQVRKSLYYTTQSCSKPRTMRTNLVPCVHKHKYR